MSPMAFNVPIAVIMSTLVAFLVTPWLGRLFLKGEATLSVTRETPWVDRYRAALEFLFANRSRAWAFLGGVLLLLAVAMLLPLLRVVPLKLLPYDNKNEFQVVIDAPVGVTLETVDRAATEIADFLTTVPEVRAVAGFSGVAAPMDFNGMVRHYYLRGREYQADLLVTLADKLNRSSASHALVLRLRPEIARIARENGVLAKLVEVPPGPPVISTVVAEHYGDLDVDYQTLIDAAEATANRLRQEAGVVDIDTSAIAMAPRRSFVPDREKAALSGISAAAIADVLQVVVAGRTVGYADVADEAVPLAIHLGVPYVQRADLGSLRVKGLPGIAKIREPLGVRDAPTPLVSLAELGTFEELQRQQPIYHKNLNRVTYAFAEVAGRVPAAVIYDVDADLGADGVGSAGRALAGRTYFTSGGGFGWRLPAGVDVVWSGEGEWDITLKVFVDLGIAFGVALVGIFFVIRLQTGLSMLTVIVMLSIPLTAIGIMPGFWLLNVVAQGRVGDYADPVLFTATAMIGMIALAGIVVRNSLILVEFVQQALARGEALTEALVQSGAIRARPILLTAGTTLLGNLVITLDPIFSGLAWSIIFGVIASTAFTLFVVPVVYHLAYGERAVA
jgi:multidrug efflux pump subunit AcrB